MRALKLFILLFCCCLAFGLQAQDTLSNRLLADTNAIRVDTNRIMRHSPRIATRRSAILPGWGQVYNREYWKVPIVWGALGTAAGVWAYNNNWYQRTRKAFTIVVNEDTARYGEIHHRLFSSPGVPASAANLQFLRNEFRRGRDYSLLYFLGIWVLNIVDATVFAHLKEFDVSDDLTLRLQPGFDPVSRSGGLSFSLQVKQTSQKKLPVMF